MPYNGPNDGFRGEVKRAALTALRHYNNDPAIGNRWECPSCGETLNKADAEDHAESCTTLRSDVADKL